MELWEIVCYSLLDLKNFLEEMKDKMTFYKVTNISEGYLVEWDGEEYI